MISIGLNTSCFQKQADRSIEEILRFVIEHGFSAVEYRDEYPFAEKLSEKELRWARGEVRSNGLVCSVHLPFYDLNLAAFREDLRLAGAQSIIRSVKAASRLGATMVTLHCGSMSRSFYGKEWMSRAADQTRKSLESILTESERYGMTLLIENLNMFSKRTYRLFSTPEALREIREELNGKIGFTFDVAHAVSTPVDPVVFVQQLEPDAVYLAHVSDNNLKAAQHLGLGEGRIDYRSFICSYLERNWNFPLLMETQTVEQALSSKRYLDDLVRELASEQKT